MKYWANGIRCYTSEVRLRGLNTKILDYLGVSSQEEMIDC